MHAARLLSKTLFLALAVVAGAGCGIEAGAPVEGFFARTLAVSGPVDLDIRTGSGGIHIDTGAGNTVHIVGRIRANTWFDTDPAGRVKEIEAHPPIEQGGNTIRIGQVSDDDLFRNISIEYEVTVPASTRVRSIAGSGGQTIRNVNGRVEATAGSGGIRIEGTGGAIDARAGSGGIIITGAKAGVRGRAGSGGIRIDGKPVDAWELQTGSGGITMSVADNTSFELDARAGSGSIRSDLPINPIDETSKHRLRGRVGSGGARVELSTGSGGIRID
jgi:putative adhesin